MSIEHSEHQGEIKKQRNINLISPVVAHNTQFPDLFREQMAMK